MTAYTLHSQGSYGLGPSGDSGAFTVGTEFEVSQSVTLTGIWFFSGSGVGGLPSACALYNASTGAQIAGTLNSSPSWSGAAGSGWVKVSYSGPTLSSSIKYVVAVYANTTPSFFYDLGHYWDTGGGSGGLTNGPLSAPNTSSAVNGQAVFAAATGISFPNSTTQGFDFGVDVEVTTTGGPVAPTQPPGLASRRSPVRVLWRGGAGQAFVAVAAPRQQPGPAPRRKLARAYVRGTPLVTSNAAPVVATTSAGPAVGVLPYAGGIILQSFFQTFTSSGSWTAPAGIIGAPAVYAWGPSGTAATGTAGTGAGGGGGGSFGGEPALGGVTPGTTLTVTIGAGGSGTATTVTGGSVTVTGNAGGNASTGTGGGAGAASTNTIAFAGGAGGNGVAGGSGGGGGGGASAGSTGAGGTGSPGSGTSGGAGGTAGTGAAGLTGAAGGNGGTASNGAAGTAPGGAGGGGSGGATHTGGAATAGQAVIVWQVLTPVPMAMQRRALARARVQFTPVRTTNPIAVPAPAQQPRTWPRRTPARAYVRFTPVATMNNTAFVSVPAPVQQPRPAPRRTPARAFIQFRPVRTTNAAPPVILGTPPTIPTSGGDRSPTIRVYREIRPGDVPSSGAQLPRLTGRAFAVPIPVDTDHVTHAWDETPDEPPPIPAGPSLLDQARTELDELAKAARDAADAIDRAADRARPIVEGIGSKAYDLGKIFGSQPYDPRPRKVCGSTHMAGGIVLTCQRKPHDDGWHSDKGLHWR